MERYVVHGSLGRGVDLTRVPTLPQGERRFVEASLAGMNDKLTTDVSRGIACERFESDRRLYADILQRLVDGRIPTVFPLKLLSRDELFGQYLSPEVAQKIDECLGEEVFFTSPPLEYAHVEPGPGHTPIGIPITTHIKRREILGTPWYLDQITSVNQNAFLGTVFVVERGVRFGGGVQGQFEMYLNPAAGKLAELVLG